MRFSTSHTSTKSRQSRFLYERGNHLGNVLTVVSDRKIAVDHGTYNSSGVLVNTTPDGITDYYLADIVSACDYYAFGSKMPGRKFNSSANKYRYGFNGKENDNETVGTDEGTQDYGMRIYNPALGRFLSVDPITKNYPELTPYQFASNKPIRAIDLDGLEALDYDFAGNAADEIMNGFIGIADWIDKTLSVTFNGETETKVKTVKLGPVTNETSVKTSGSTTISTNLANKLKYIKLNNSNVGDNSSLIVTDGKKNVSTENKTSYKTHKGSIYNATAINNEGTVTNETGAIVETKVRGVPVVVKTSSSSNTNGEKTTTIKTGVGNSDESGGIIYSNTKDKAGNTTNSGGAYFELSEKKQAVSGSVTIDVKTPK